MDLPPIVEQPEGGGPDQPIISAEPKKSWISRFWKAFKPWICCCSSADLPYEILQNETVPDEAPVYINPEERQHQRRLARQKEKLERELKKQAEERERFRKEQERKEYEHFFVRQVDQSELPKEEEKVPEDLHAEQKDGIEDFLHQSMTDFTSSFMRVEPVEQSQLVIIDKYFYLKGYMTAHVPQRGGRYLIKHTHDCVSSRVDVLYCLAYVHPNIMSAVKSTIGDSYRLRFLIMSYNGMPLSEVVEHFRFDRRSLALMVTRQVGQAVKFLRNNCIMHRQICPENIFIDDYHVRLANFEMAAEFGRGKVLEKCGQLHYQAPEMFLGKGYSFEADCYSIGVCYYVILHGAKPTSGMNREEMEQFYDPLNYKIKINKEYFHGIFRLTHYLLSLRPEMRYTPMEIAINCGSYLHPYHREPSVFNTPYNKEEDFFMPQFEPATEPQQIGSVINTEQGSSKNITVESESVCPVVSKKPEEQHDSAVVIATEVLANGFSLEEGPQENERVAARTVSGLDSPAQASSSEAIVEMGIRDDDTTASGCSSQSENSDDSEETLCGTEGYRLACKIFEK